jgi:DNA-binding MarR family transcriptional regulator
VTTTSQPTIEQLGSDLVVHAARLVRVVARATASEAPAGLRLLSQLDELGPVTVTELARADRSSQPTTSAAVSGLEQRALIGRVPHPTDARSHRVELTAHGRAVLAQARERHGRILADQMTRRSLDPSDLERAVDLLRRLTTTPDEQEN